MPANPRAPLGILVGQLGEPPVEIDALNTHQALIVGGYHKEPVCLS